MADYVVDWATANADGANAVLDSGGGNPVTVTVATPANASAGGEFSYDAASNGLASSFPASTQPAHIDMTFSEEVSNVTFDISDIDQHSTWYWWDQDWDDKVEIFAYDAAGTRLDVTFSGLDGQIVTAYSIEGNSTLYGQAITVNIAGPVASLSVVFDHGSDVNNAGWISVGDVSFDAYTPPCFVRGTMIETRHGDVAIESLAKGDLVLTADHGYQAVRWIGSTTVSGLGKSAPILFRKGVLGNHKDLQLSPAHRVVLKGWQAELLFGAPEVLVSAAALVNDRSVTVRKTDKVTYYHVMFDQHEIIYSNGASTESFHPGEADVSLMAKAARGEILGLFPELQYSGHAYGPAARAALHPYEAQLLRV